MTVTLSRAYRRRFTDAHRDVAAIPLGPTPLTSFWPMVGQQYDAELVVIGRAVNSWRTEWTVAQGQTDEVLVDDAIAVNSVMPDPMDWVLRLWGKANATEGAVGDP